MQSTKLVLSNIDWSRVGQNLIKFTAPALVVFFGQLALKVDWKASALVALLTLYGALSDFFRKYGESKQNLVQ